MPILIDGHNLIGRLPALSLQDPDDEEKLVRLLASYRARTGKAITVVFDPGEASTLAGARRWGGIEVLFARRGSNADALIARRVQKSQHPPAWLVVTSDGKLAEAVARTGARVQSAETFAAELMETAEEAPDWKDRPPSPDEVEEWLDLFEGRD